MAEDFDFESKTEEATPRRREEAAERGQFALSSELTTGVVLMVGVGGLSFLAHSIGQGLLAETRADLIAIPTRELPVDLVQTHFLHLAARAVAIGGILIGGIFVAAFAASVAQVGLRWNPDRVSFDWERVAPMQWERLLSGSKIVRGFLLLIKVCVVTMVAWWILRHRGGEIACVADVGLGAALANAWAILLRLALGMAAALLVIGVADYAYQFWHFERSLRMTRQELKEELKREDGDPQIKQRIRRMQRDAAQRKMFHEVPKATVVVTNPTHLAIALRYEAGEMTAPRVVAKGAGHLAKKIVETARRHGVPVVQRKPLAQALFKTVKVGREVPLGLYLVVAELLAYVYRLKGGTPSIATRQTMNVEV